MRPRLSFEQYASDRLLDDRSGISRLWAHEVVDVLGVDPFGSEPDRVDPDALVHLLGAIARYVENGEATPVSADDDVRAATTLFGEWCARHGSDGRAVVDVFDRLAALLDHACASWMNDYPAPTPAVGAMSVAARLNRAPIVMAAECVGAYERAWATSPTRGDFMELLVHELSTPINAAEIAAVLLESDSATPGSMELRRHAGAIQRNLRRMRALIGDLRDLSAAHHPARHEERMLPIGQVIGDVIAEVSPAARQAGVHVAVEEPIPARRVPGARVALVLRNLISNAIKYADPGANMRWVRISFDQDESGGIVIAVSDNGLGIATADHHRVFRRFTRLHAEHADGTGLGLAIAREAAARMKAAITFESEPGVGSTFRFQLPPDPSRSAN